MEKTQHSNLLKGRNPKPQPKPNAPGRLQHPPARCNRPCRHSNARAAAKPPSPSTRRSKIPERDARQAPVDNRHASYPRGQRRPHPGPDPADGCPAGEAGQPSPPDQHGCRARGGAAAERIDEKPRTGFGPAAQRADGGYG